MRLDVSSLDSTPTTQDADFPWRTKLSQGRSSVPAQQMFAGETEGAAPQGQGTHRGIPSILPSDAVSPNRLVVSGSSAFPACSSGIQGPTCRVSPPAPRGAGRGTRSP